LLAFGATIFGLAAGVGLAFLREIIGLGVFSVRPSLVVTDLPLLAVFPNGAELQPLAIFGNPTSRVASETRKLQNALRAIQQKNFGRAVLFVGQNSNDDVTPVVLNLASVAAAKQKVLLIDADIRRPTLSALFPDQSRLGFVDVAAGSARLRDAMVCDPRTSINYLPLIAANNRKHRQINPGDIKSAFDQTELFDLVIVAATIRKNDLSAFLFAELVDHIVLVVKAEEARKPDLADAFSNLEIEAEKIRGVVFTSTGPVDVTRAAGEPIWDRRRSAPERNPEEASLVL
jgi:Mrp family chromosome partitioning ATPase